MSTSRKVSADEETADRLRGWFEESGHVAYTLLGHVSESGMTRDIGVRVFLPNDGGGDPVVVLDLDYNVAAITGRSLTPRGVRCAGAGMDMGFELIYNVSMALYGDGYKLKQRWL